MVRAVLRIHDDKWFARRNGSIIIYYEDRQGGAYRLLRNLCAPALPKSRSLNELVTLITNHLKPKPSTLTQRYKFKECKQKSGETVSEYLTTLKQISLYCEFGQNLDTHLRDQLVWGLSSERMTKRLLSEPDLTLEKAMDICTSMEAAERDVAHILF